MRFLSCLPLLYAIGLAQSGPGTITGVVSDSLGASVDNAPVQLKDAATGHVRSSATSKTGKYTLSDLPAGRYDLSVSVGGLKPFQKRDVSLAAGQNLQLDIRLEDTTQLNTLGEDRLAIAAAIKRHQPPSGPTPRTAAGKPDLSGVWWNPATVDPGKPEFLPHAQEIADQRQRDNRKDSPQAHCLPSAVTRVGPLFQFVQSAAYLVEISDDDSPGFHQIYLDGRPHPRDPNPAWYGHSIGRWDGDTLVVDRVGFDSRVWLDQDSHPHTDKLHVIERYQRPDLGHLEIEITVEDPGVLARPWTMKRAAELAPGEQIYEFICPENNRDVQHLVGK